MYTLATAKVYYGISSYDLHGLPERYDRVTSIRDVNRDELTREVGRITSFPREFKVDLMPELNVNGIIIKERIVASANGYSLVWVKED